MVSPTQLESRMREIRQSGSEGGEVMSLLDPYQIDIGNEPVLNLLRGVVNSKFTVRPLPGSKPGEVTLVRWSAPLCGYNTPATLYDPGGIEALSPHPFESHPTCFLFPKPGSNRIPRA